MSEIFPLGYAAKGCDEDLARLMADPQMVLIDIRLSPVSRFRPAYRRAALQEQYADRYVHVPELGNVHYRDRSLPMVLQDATVGIDRVLAYLFKGHSVVLLCACADFQTCHRRLVYALVQREYEACLDELALFYATPSYVERFATGRATFDMRVSPASVLNLRAFTAWLGAHSSEVVGSAALEEACPLARFLADMTGSAYHVSYDDYSLVGDAEPCALLPKWARVLVRSLDFSFPLSDLTGEQVLRLLLSVVESLRLCRDMGQQCMEVLS